MAAAAASVKLCPATRSIYNGEMDGWGGQRGQREREERWLLDKALRMCFSCPS